MNIIRIALIAPQEKDRQQLREQMFSYAVRWKVAVVTDCFDCLEEFAMAAQSGGYQLVCLRGGERQWRAAEELRRIRRAVQIPVVVIGGINRDTAPLFHGTGINGLAVVSAVVGQRDIPAAARELRAIFQK